MENVKTRGRKPGSAKTGGRVKGTPNKVTTITRDIINKIAEDIMPSLADDIKKLEPKDRMNVFIKLIEFIVPKPRIDVEISGETRVTIEETLKILAKENE